MALTPGTMVAAPEPLRRRYGLFDAAIGPLDLPTHGEAGGVVYVPVTCGEAHVYGVNCYQGEVAAPVKPLGSDEGSVNPGVFVVLSTINCGAVGNTRAEYETKVRRQLEGNEQAAVERALWSGLDFAGNSLGVLTLADNAELVDPGYDPGLITDVVGALERYAYTEHTYGWQAYIHAPIEVAAFAAEAGLIVADGNRKVTPMGSVWVFGAYPAGDVIITGQTTVWRSSEVQVYSSFENVSNELLLVAERAYSVGFDCFAGSAEYNPLEVS